jgi:hypothetical protein
MNLPPSFDYSREIPAPFNQGVIMAKRGQFDEAGHEFEETIRLEPEYQQARPCQAAGSVTEGSPAMTPFAGQAGNAFDWIIFSSKKIACGRCLKNSAGSPGRKRNGGLFHWW